MCELIQ